MNRLTKVTLQPAAASANNIALSQTPGAAGALTLNGALVVNGIAVLDLARRVLITGAGNESAKTFTVTGTNRDGRALTETLAGPNAGAVGTVNDFLTVSSVVISAAAAGAVTVGTSGIVSSRWFPVDYHKTLNLGFDVTVSGTVNYTIEHTYEDPQSGGVGMQPPGGAVPPVLTPFPHSVVAAQAGNKDGNYIDQPITAVRITLNSFTNPGSVTANFSPGPTLR